MKQRISLLIIVIPFLLFPVLLRAGELPPLTFGMSAAFSGPAKELGVNMKIGIETCFRQVNERGGVAGRELRLEYLDDSYEPQYSARNVLALMETKYVPAFIGNVGTPTAKAALPFVVEEGVLYYAALSGSSILRSSPEGEGSDPDSHLRSKYVINYRASYAQETEKIIENLLQGGIRPYEIALFTQNDSYGQDGYKGAIQALKKRGYHDLDKIPSGTYERNTLNIEGGLLEILTAKRGIKAVIIVGSYKPVAKFITFAQKLLPGAFFINVSFVGCSPLAQLLGENDHNVYVTEIVPHFDSNLPIVREYRATLKRHFPDAQPNFVSLEGYIAAKIFVEGLKKAKNFSPEGIIAGIKGFDSRGLNLGFPIRLGENDTQASDNVWLTEIRQGACKEIDWNGFIQRIQGITNLSPREK